MKLNQLAITLTAALLCAACQTVPDADTTQFNKEGKPPAYTEGHADGCRSGFNAAGNPYYKMTKDPQRFASDQMYAQGWTDGYSTCKSKYENFDK
jgi:hypothetical protein